MTRVRDDPSGHLSATLDRHIAAGRVLLEAGGEVGDAASLARWSQLRRDWRRGAGLTLEREFEPEAVLEFLRASAEPRERRTLPVPSRRELVGLLGAIELLGALRTSLWRHGGRQPRPPEPVPSGEPWLAALAKL